MAGGLLDRDPLDRDPPRTETPPDRDPLDRDTAPLTESPLTETPGQRPPLWTEPQTGVKTLPYRNFVANGKDADLKVFIHSTSGSRWITVCK